MRSWDICLVSFTLCHQLLSFPCCRTGCHSNFYAFRKLKKKKSDILVFKIDSRAQLICICLVASRRLWGWKTTWKGANDETGKKLWAFKIKDLHPEEDLQAQELRSPWDTHWHGMMLQEQNAPARCEPALQEPCQQHQLTGNITRQACLCNKTWDFLTVLMQ